MENEKTQNAEAFLELGWWDKTKAVVKETALLGLMILVVAFDCLRKKVSR